MAARRSGPSHRSNNSNSSTDSKVLATELVSNLNTQDIQVNSLSSSSNFSLSRQGTQFSSSSNHNLLDTRSNLSSRNRLAFPDSKAFNLNLLASRDSNKDFSLKRLDTHLSMLQARSLSSSSSSLRSLHNRRNSNQCSNSKRALPPLPH